MQENKQEKSEISEAQLDQAVAAMIRSPLCCRCGAQLQGLPVGQAVACPRCKNMMRHSGGIFLEYVSPLEVSGGARSGLRNLIAGGGLKVH